MAEIRKPVATGGCQCGMVRFAAYVEPREVDICHCRMCQKAMGGPFAAFAAIGLGDFAWTRGQPQSFRSSSLSTRDFCGACGTPLTYRVIGDRTIWLTTGSFDDPTRVIPTVEVGQESKLAWIDSICRLAGKTTLENMGADTVSCIVSFQHPDHDTASDWVPPKLET